MIPTTYTLLDTLPLTPNGKTDYRALPTPEPANTGSTDYTPAQTPAQALLVRIWEETLQVQPVGINDSFFALGGHSLLALSLADKIQQAFGGELPLAALYQNPTPAELAARLERAPDADWPSSIVPLKATGDRPPLFCVHPKNGTVFSFTALARTLAAECPLYGVQAHSLDLERKPHDSIEEMAAAYVQDIIRVQPEGPYHLCGYSLGGMIAYEMARQLTALGREVARLVLLDSAPHLEAGFPSLAELESMDDVTFLITEFAEAVPVTEEALRPLAPEQRIKHVLDLAVAAGFHMEHMDLRTMTRYTDIARAHTRAALAYRPGPYTGSALLVRCADPTDSAEADPSWGWQALVGDGLTIREVTGNHRTIVDAPHVIAVSEHVSDYLT
ncbi:hypothetical protein C2142_30385 [Streptomyces sp. CB01881]|nr:hypothetical protein C2142_30385 [Streptomyces sp. CB01881]